MITATFFANYRQKPFACARRMDSIYLPVMAMKSGALPAKIFTGIFGYLPLHTFSCRVDQSSPTFVYVFVPFMYIYPYLFCHKGPTATE